MIHRKFRVQRSARGRSGSGLDLVCWPRPRFHTPSFRERWLFGLVQCAWRPIKAVLLFLWSPLTLFRFSKVPVQVHSTFLLCPVGFFAWDLCLDYSNRGLIRALAVLFVFSGSLLVHEFAHVLTARHWGIGSRRVILIPLGAAAVLESVPGVPSELWIALAGPLASLILGGIFWIALRTMPSPIWSWLTGRYWYLDMHHISAFGFGFNVIVALFNLLPCFPMDGGRALRAGLALIIGRLLLRPAKPAFLVATRIAVRYVAWPLALGMMALTIFHTQSWMDLVLFPLLLLCGEAEYWLLRNPESPSRGDDQ